MTVPDWTAVPVITVVVVVVVVVGAIDAPTAAPKMKDDTATSHGQ